MQTEHTSYMQCNCCNHRISDWAMDTLYGISITCFAIATVGLIAASALNLSVAIQLFNK